MIRRIGSGSFRTRVGTAMISSLRARSGCSTRSTSSIVYRPGRYSSQRAGGSRPRAPTWGSAPRRRGAGGRRRPGPGTGVTGPSRSSAILRRPRPSGAVGARAALLLGEVPGAAGAGRARPGARRRRPAARIPWSVSRNSRTWFECAVPRLLITNSTRLRSPSLSMLRSTIQVSISDETADELVSLCPSWIRLVSTAVMPRRLQHVQLAGDRGGDLGADPDVGQAAHRVEHGDRGWTLVEQLLDPVEVGLEAERGRPARPTAAAVRRRSSGCRSMPTERMLRTIWPGDSSNETNSAFSPRRAGGGHGLRGERRLAGAGRTADQHGGPAVDAAARACRRARAPQTRRARRRRRRSGRPR